MERGRTMDMKKYLGVVLPALLSVLLFGLVVFFFLRPHMREMVLDAKRELIQELSLTCWQMFASLEKQERRGVLTRAQAQACARQAVRDFRFGPERKDYFWVVDLEGRSQANPYHPEDRGKSVLGLTDPQGKHFIRRALEIARTKGEGYLTYVWYRKGDNSRLEPKIVHVRLFKPWGWVIAAGVYMGDVEAENRQMNQRLLLAGVGVLLLVVLVAAYITWRQMLSEHRRLAAEGALREALDKYRAVLESSPNPLVVYDTEGRAVYINPAFTRVFGWKAEDVLGRRIDFVPEQYLPETKAAIREVYSNQEGLYSLESRRLTKDGRVLDVYITAAIYRDASGEPLGMVANISDISQRKAAEWALRQSERHYRALFESAHDAIFILHRNRIEDCNQQAEKMLGGSREQIVGLVPEHFSPERQPDGNPTRELAERLIRETLDKGSASFEWRLRRLGGGEFDAEVSLSRIEMSSGPRILAIVRDVTERRAAAEALRESEERLRTVINATPVDVVCFKDGQGRWLEANQANLELFGLVGVDYRGKTNAELAELVPPVSRQAFLANQEREERAWRSGHIHRGEETVPLPNGRVRVFDAIRVPLFFSDGRRKGLVVYARDITERVEAEREREEMERQLRHSQKMEAIGTLAGGIAHDFNNLLTAIIGYTETAMIKASQGQDYSQGLKVVLDASFRARDLVKQLHTFSRGREGEARPLDLSHILRDTMKLVEAVTPSLIEVRTRVLSSGTVVKADPIQLQQVIMNLCTNAVQAMGEKGGSLEVCLETVRLAPGETPLRLGLEPGGYVVLEVRDTGPGMDEELRKKIFDPFFTTKPRDKGTGLGLSVVHGIVASLGGAVMVDSQPGRGTAFRVYLPQAEEEPAAPGAGREGEPLPGCGTLLLVEDELQVLKVEQEILESLGYEVVPCLSPVEACRILEAEPGRFSLVITDYAMPDMSGLELASAIKEVAPQVPILLCTGYDQGLSPHELKIFGVDQTLSKPFTAYDLSRKLHEMLPGRDAGQEPPPTATA